MNIRWTKSLALLLTAAVFTAALNGGAGLGQAASEAAASVPAPTGSQTEQEGYHAYLLDHADVADGRQDVRFPAGSTQTQGDGVERLTYQGVEQALMLRDGAAVWAFTVPQTGWYEIDVQYCALLGSSRLPEVELKIDGALPFDECRALTLERLWENETDEAHYDAGGNQYAAKQVELTAWAAKRLTDPNRISSAPLRFALEAGRHTLSLEIGDDPVVLGEIAVAAPETSPAYEAYIAPYHAAGKRVLRIEAENASRKSDQSLRPLSDTSDPLMQPYSPNKLRINMIGSTYWETQGQWLEWDIDVPEDGLYQLAFRYRQNYMLGYDTYRTIRIDGAVPFREMSLVSFPFTTGWACRKLESEDGGARYVYLTKGSHRLRMEVTLGPLSEIVYELNEVVRDLNRIYRKILMITSATPDPYRDYDLPGDIPNLLEQFEANARRLEDSAAAIQKRMKQGGDAGILKTLVRQLRGFCDQPDTIPSRLSSFEGNVTSLSTWIAELQRQPLDLDALFLAQEGGELPAMKAGVFRRFAHAVQQFVYSFYEDYNSYAGQDTDTQITLWTGLGTEQAQILRRLIDEQFTPQSHISVDLKVVSSSMVEAFLSGTSPDTTILLGRGQPVNLAIRGALLDLTQFRDFGDVYASFGESAMRPYHFQNGYYALPDTESFYMMFVRTDILEELHIAVPDTWEAFYQAIPQIQQYNMDVGLPYTAIDVSGSVDAGMGTRNLYPALLLQAGGRFYTEDLSRTALNTSMAMAAFEQWTALYQTHSVPLSYDFFNRFRTGAVPIAIAAYTEYNRLITAAPEIRQQWVMRPLPGTKKADGTLDITQAGSGTGAVILCNTAHPAQAWEFLKWWTGEQAQAQYGREVEAQLGVVARQATANKQALAAISYPEDVLNALMTQWNAVENIEEVPGSYYLLRGLDNAFRSVLYQDQNPYEALGLWNEKINQELQRKREEFGLGYSKNEAPATAP